MRCWDLDTAAPTPITTAQTLAPNDVTNIRWQEYLGVVRLYIQSIQMQGKFIALYLIIQLQLDSNCAKFLSFPQS